MTLDSDTRPGYLMTRRATSGFLITVEELGYESADDLFSDTELPTLNEKVLFGVFLQHYAKQWADSPDNPNERNLGYNSLRTTRRPLPARFARHTTL
jgi:hypothetical protein